MNKYFSIEAPAKLNLNLFVKKKYTNGLHFLESDICFLGLTDKIFFQFSNIDLFYQCNKEEELIIDPNNNLILQALKKFRNLTGWKKCFSIFLKKNIPIGAGLGGGSADAAATLVVLKKLFNFDTKENKITKNILYDIAKEIGSDIPACIESKDLRLKGYGDKIFRIKNPNNFYFLIIYPNIKLSTKDVFKHYEKNPIKIKGSNVFWENININNSLLPSAVRLAPDISNVLNTLKKSKNVKAYGMTGSGSSCFGIFENLNDITSSLKFFDKRYFIWFGEKKNYNLNRVRYSKVLENKF